MATIDQWTPHEHKITGRVGDGVPVYPRSFDITRNGATIDKADWIASAQLRLSPTSPDVAHQFGITLEDALDVDTLDPDVLRITLAPLTGAETTALGPGEWVGDIEIQADGEEPLTIVTLTLTLTGDVTRP